MHHYNGVFFLGSLQNSSFIQCVGQICKLTIFECSSEDRHPRFVKKRVIEERKGPFAILPKMVTTIDKRKNSVRIQIVYAGF